MAKKEKSNKPAVLSGTVPEWASTSVIAQLLGKTVRRVQQLTQEGVLETELLRAAAQGSIALAKRSSVMFLMSKKKRTRLAKTAERPS